MHIEKTISYYQDCYKQEFRDSDVLNFLGSKVDKRFFLNNLDQLYGEKDAILLDSNFGEELFKYLEIHKKEKTLIAGSFFLTGKLSFLGKKRTICAPIIISPLNLDYNNVLQDRIYCNFNENRINNALLHLIKTNFDLDDSFILEIKSLIKNVTLKNINIEGLIKKLQTYITLEAQSIKKLPRLFSGQQLRHAVKSESLQIVPSIALGIIEKSKSNRDVLYEIDEIKSGHLYNQTLHHFFSRRKVDTDTDFTHKPTVYVPSNLSNPQLNIIHAAKANDLTVVIGPPGTGKSYTIASLAIDQVYRGNSVLICSKSDQAVDVLYNKIIHDLGIKGLSIRAGSGRNHRSKLRKKVEAISRYRHIGSGSYKISQKQWDIKDVEKKLKEISNEIAKREVKEIKKTALFLDHKLTFFKRLKRKYISKKILEEYPFWQLIELLQQYTYQKNKLVKELILMKYQDDVWNLIRKDRTFPKFLKLLKTKDTIERERLFQTIDFDPLLKCLPIWIAKATDMSELFPLHNDIFDIVIIDEASQCDIATMIPVLARSKKVVVVGDPKQLKHVSFLSKKILEETANSQGLIHEVDVLNYRENSFLDYSLDRLNLMNNIHFLNEHYRSVPNIIRYSNQKFYFDKLNIMSDLYIHHKEDAIHWIFCQGYKGNDGINLLEAKKILDDIQQLILEENTLDTHAASTIGILSPFRDQVNFLKKELNKFDLTAIRKHKIIVGTPYEFQGEERDFMYISFTIDNTTGSTVFQYLNKEDVFNVSITRAKEKQFLYYSFDPKNFKNTHLLIEYFSETQIHRQRINPPNEYMDNFAAQVYEELIRLGVSKENILVNYPVAGYQMDVVITYNQKTLYLDLIGYPGELEKTFSIDQYKTLFRTNIPIIAIPYTYWLLNKNACLDHISKKIHLKT